MTMEAYVNSVLAANPDFVEKMGNLIATEYASQIAETRASYTSRVEAARNSWCSKRGETAYEANKAEIEQHIASTMPRFAYIKHIELSGDTFDACVDLLEGTWSITPV